MTTVLSDGLIHLQTSFLPCCTLRSEEKKEIDIYLQMVHFHFVRTHTHTISLLNIGIGEFIAVQ